MFRPIFHLAFPVRDLEETKNFYVTNFGARVGRVRDKWSDIFLFEGQITLHERPSEVLPAGEAYTKIAYKVSLCLKDSVRSPSS